MEPVRRRCPVTRVGAMAFRGRAYVVDAPLARTSVAFDLRAAYAIDAPLGRRHFGDLERKTVEAWLLHDFAADFYGRTLRLLIVGYVRPELKFDSLDGLVAAIRADGDFVERELGDAPEDDDGFFVAPA